MNSNNPAQALQSRLNYLDATYEFDPGKSITCLIYSFLSILLLGLFTCHPRGIPTNKNRLPAECIWEYLYLSSCMTCRITQVEDRQPQLNGIFFMYPSSVSLHAIQNKYWHRQEICYSSESSLILPPQSRFPIHFTVFA